mgnify:CR=1 FL=1
MSNPGKESFEALFYAGTKTLINHFGIQDPDKLAQIEKGLTAAATYDLLKLNPVKGDFDLAHMREIHRRLMGDVYPWAGEIRDFPLFKKRSDGFTTEFARPDEIPQLDQKIREIMKATEGFSHVPTGQFVETMAKTYQLANEMHPFREGNGRTQRIFLTYLAERAGYELKYSAVAPEAWNHAASMSARINIGNGDRVPGRTAELEKVFAHISSPLRPMSAYQQGREGLSAKQSQILTLAELAPGFKPGYTASRRLR